MVSARELASHPLLRPAPEPALEVLARLVAERRYAADEVLFLAGAAPEGLYLVMEGRVRVLRGRGGRQHVIHTEQPGGTLGEVPLFAGGGYPATAIASEPTRCIVLSRSALRAAFATAPDFALLILERLALRVRLLVERLDGVASRSATARLARYLLDRRHDGSDYTVSLGLTQSRLAEELGTVREIVVRSLRMLCRRGLIERVGSGRLRIRDPEGLARAAEL